MAEEETQQPSTNVTTREDVVQMLKTIFDPELYVDIYTLGLIYDIEVLPPALNIRMTFTSMACPAGPQLIEEVKTKAKDLPGIEQTNVEVVFTPPWKPSDELKALLGLV